MLFNIDKSKAVHFDGSSQCKKSKSNCVRLEVFTEIKDLHVVLTASKQCMQASA